MDAWAAGDRAAAARVATSSAVASLFALPYPRGALQARGCTEGVSPGTCTYRNLTTGGIYELGLLDGPAGWYVDAVTPES